MGTSLIPFIHMQSLHDILKKIVKDQGLEGGAVMRAIGSHWSGIVGETIAAHTCPDTVRGKTLTMIVDSPQWMHHLGFFKDEIIKKLQQFDIDEIRFRQGKLPEIKVKAPVEEIDVELSDDDLRYIENTVRNIDDDELRKRFRKLIAHGLTKGKKG